MLQKKLSENSQVKKTVVEYTFCHLLRDSSWRGQGIFKKSCFRLRVNKKSSSERHSYFMPMPKNIFKVGELVRTKAKERISKQVFQESKARQIFRKTNISYLLIRTRTCAYQEIRNFHFLENLACFVFLKHPF